MRVALVGAGGMAQQHLQAYGFFPDLAVTSITDPNAEAARQAAEPLGAHVYTSFDEMLTKETPDIVDICAPSFLHYEYSIKALQKGLHVFCEKPMAHSVAEADEMVALAKKQGKVLMVGQVLRYWPEYRVLAQMYHERPYGPLRVLQMTRQYGAHEPGTWYMDPERCKMVGFEMHIHDSDFVNYLFGLPQVIDSVGVEQPDIHLSVLSTRYQFPELPIVIEATGGWSDSTLPFAGGYKAVFEHAVLEYADWKLMLYPAGGEPTPVEPPMPDLPREVPSGIAGVYQEIAELIGQIRGEGGTPTVTMESARDTIRIVEAERASREQGAPVRL